MELLGKVIEDLEQVASKVDELYEYHSALVEQVKEDAIKQLSLESLLIDNNILTQEEMDERFELFKLYSNNNLG